MEQLARKLKLSVKKLEFKSWSSQLEKLIRSGESKLEPKTWSAYATPASRRLGRRGGSTLGAGSEPGGQIDGFAVGCAAIGFRPSFLARDERGRIGQSFCRHQALESREPMIVVARAVVGLTAIGCGFELAGQRGGPFFPGEMTLFGKPHC